MGKARNGSISKTFLDDGNTKVKARFANEQHARRVAILIQYMQYAYHDGIDPDEHETIDDLLASDFSKAKEIIRKIEAAHEH